jgi:hypothetical protein
MPSCAEPPATATGPLPSAPQSAPRDVELLTEGVIRAVVVGIGIGAGTSRTNVDDVPVEHVLCQGVPRDRTLETAAIHRDHVLDQRVVAGEQTR